MSISTKCTQDFQLLFSFCPYNIEEREVLCVRILIVEDEKLLAQSLKTLLERKGFAVELAYEGATRAE